MQVLSIFLLAAGASALQIAAPVRQCANCGARAAAVTMQETEIIKREERRRIMGEDKYKRGGAPFDKAIHKDVAQKMSEKFKSEMIAELKEDTFRKLERGEGNAKVTFTLAEEYGFCWGVERSIELAWAARDQYPDKKMHITNELIHNPGVNDMLGDMEVAFIEKTDTGKRFDTVEEGDVVILPAFGASLEEMQLLDSRDVTVVDTTCPWVSKVWTTVDKHQRADMTSLIHGKWQVSARLLAALPARRATCSPPRLLPAPAAPRPLPLARRPSLSLSLSARRRILHLPRFLAPPAQHEEAIATASMCTTYLIIKNMDEAAEIAAYILGEEGAITTEELMEKYKNAMSPHFDPKKHLKRIGLANQTTMYKKETQAIGRLFEKTMMAAYGAENIKERFAAFDTICDATQVRQDAITEMSESPEAKDLDFILVVGGWDSSNTAHLLEIPHDYGLPAFHVNEPGCIKPENTIEHRTVDGKIETAVDFLPLDRPARIGITSGASTPDSVVQECLEAILLIKKVQSA